VTTRTYSELNNLIQALCGEVFAVIEQPRIKALVNRRAKRAYHACTYWPRFLKVAEERTVTSNVIPYTESSKSDIGSFLRIYVTQPFQQTDVQQYDFFTDADGAHLIAGNSNPATAYVTYQKPLADVYGEGSGETSAIPSEWFEYIAHGVYSDWLRAEKMPDQAVIADQEADLLLQDELVKVDIQGTPNLVLARNRTNANMQTRW